MPQRVDQLPPPTPLLALITASGHQGTWSPTPRPMVHLSSHGLSLEVQLLPFHTKPTNSLPAAIVLQQGCSFSPRSACLDGISYHLIILLMFYLSMRNSSVRENGSAMLTFEMVVKIITTSVSEIK